MNQHDVNRASLKARGVLRFALSVAIVACSLISQGGTPTCEDLFLSTPILTMLEVAQITRPDEKVRLQFGNAEAENLFGHDTSRWPVLIGAMKDGHVFVAHVRHPAPGYSEYTLEVDRELPFTFRDYIRHLDAQVDPKSGAGESLNSVLTDLERNFNMRLAAAASKLNLSILDEYSNDLTENVSTRGPIGFFEQPWLRRQIRVVVARAPNRWRPATLAELTALAQELMK